MTFEFLNEMNVEQFIDYLNNAFADEPNNMVAESVEAEQIRQRVIDSFYTKTKSILAIENGNVIGQIEYHFYGCIQDGSKMAYVDWVHVLLAHRKRGVATSLFKQFEKDCMENDINQYYLIRCEDECAKIFYDRFENSQTTLSPILRRMFK